MTKNNELANDLLSAAARLHEAYEIIDSHCDVYSLLVKEPVFNGLCRGIEIMMSARNKIIDIAEKLDAKENAND